MVLRLVDFRYENPDAMPENLKQCKKCKAVSGDDWEQCDGRCPLERSTHYDRATADYYGPPRELTRDEYLAERQAEWDAYDKLREVPDEDVPF